MNIVQRVDDWITIRRVLVSVSDKTGLDILIPGLIGVNRDVQFYSTGGTFAAIAEILGPERTGRHLTAVADYTGQPEMQGGLVKTLDFKIYLGLLAETYNSSHQSDLVRTGALPIDMVVVNLYPFQATVARADVTVEEARANIDIGGPCMVRAAAKNYLRVAVVVEPAEYPVLLATLQAHDGKLNLKRRFELARRGFDHTAAYDRAINAFLAEQDPAAAVSSYIVE